MIPYLVQLSLCLHLFSVVSDKKNMDKMKRFWGIARMPTANSKIQTFDNFIKKHKLCVTRVGKDKNKKRILIDIEMALNKKIIPKDILSHIFSFLHLKQRIQLSIISKQFQKSVILTIQNDHNIKIRGVVKRGEYQIHVM